MNEKYDPDSEYHFVGELGIIVSESGDTARIILTDPKLIENAENYDNN